MKKLFLLFILVVSLNAYSQINGGIHVSYTPYGKLTLKHKTEPPEMLVSPFYYNNPMLRLGFHTLGDDDPSSSRLIEFGFSKYNFINDLGVNDIQGNYYSLMVYHPLSINFPRRVQFYLYGGMGLDYATQIDTALFPMIGAKAQFKFYMTPRLALYGGAYYIRSVLNKKYAASNMGVETGLLFSFGEAWEYEYRGRKSKSKKARQTMRILLVNDWDEPLDGARISLAYDGQKLLDSPTYTDHTYVFSSLRSGPYTITVEREGYQTLSQEIYVIDYSKRDRRHGAATNSRYKMRKVRVGTRHTDPMEAIKNAVVEKTVNNVTYYEVTNCDILEYELNEIMDGVNFSLVKSYKESRDAPFFGKENHVTAFLFRNLMEEKVRNINANRTIKMPSLLDVKASEKFYVSYIKDKDADLTRAYLDLFHNVHTIYIKKDHKAGVSRLCEASPYESDIMSYFSVLNLLEKYRDGSDFVYYLKPNYGYIVNNARTYTGDIVNGKMHGHGCVEVGVYDDGFLFTRRIMKDFYEGEFKNGKKNGTMFHKSFRNAFIGFLEIEINAGIVIQEKGTMVDDHWEGIVDVKVTCEKVVDAEDHYFQKYENGVMVKKVYEKADLTSYFMLKELDELMR